MSVNLATRLLEHAYRNSLHPSLVCVPQQIERISDLLIVHIHKPMIAPSYKDAVILAISDLLWPAFCGFAVGKFPNQCTRQQVMHRKSFAVVDDIFTISIAYVCMPSVPALAHFHSVRIYTHIPGMMFREATTVALLPFSVYLDLASVRPYTVALRLWITHTLPSWNPNTKASS